MEAGDCPTLKMNAMENHLLSHSLINIKFLIMLLGPKVPQRPFMGFLSNVLNRVKMETPTNKHLIGYQ